jgi:hypothetical protein
MTNIVAPYNKNDIESDPSLCEVPDQKAIIMIDCYPVHTGKDFRTYVLEEHPHVFLVFVPANCTSIFQVADVGLQRIIKHRLAQHELQWFVDSHTTQMQAGKTPNNVEFTKSLPKLRNATVKPIMEVYKWLQSAIG